MDTSKLNLTGGSFKNFRVPDQAENPQPGQLAVANASLTLNADGQNWNQIADLTSAWTPANLIVPPKVRLDDLSQVENVSGACSQWYDTSGNDYHFVQTTAGKRPSIIADGLNGYRILSLDGVDDEMVSTSTGARSIFSSVSSGWCFAIYRRRATTVRDSVLFQSNLPTGFYTRFLCLVGTSTPANRQSNPRLYVRRLDADTPQQVGAGPETGTNWAATAFYVDYQARTGNIIINGGAVQSYSPMSTAGVTSSGLSYSGIYIGSGGNTATADIDLACVLIGSGTLPTDDEFQRLFGYYMHRYGLQDQLPDDHPYKLSPPVI